MRHLNYKRFILVRSDPRQAGQRVFETGQSGPTLSHARVLKTRYLAVLFDQNQCAQPAFAVGYLYRRAEARLAKHDSETSLGADLSTR